jgi:hypothetical protein
MTRVRFGTTRQAVPLLSILGSANRKDTMSNHTKYYRTIADIRAADRAAGGYFFSREAMRFFKSQVYRGVYGGKYFVTSEKSPHNPRRYTVRRIDSEAVIWTASDEVATLADARALAREFALRDRISELTGWGRMILAAIPQKGGIGERALAERVHMLSDYASFDHCLEELRGGGFIVRTDWRTSSFTGHVTLTKDGKSVIEVTH